MSTAPNSSDTAALPRLAASTPTARVGAGHSPEETVRPAPLAATLTDLSSMVSRVHAIRGRQDVIHDIDQRLIGVIAELESLIHDLLHDSGSRSNGQSMTRGASWGATPESDRTSAEAALEAWLTSEDKPDLWNLGPAEQPTSLTGILGGLVLSQRQLLNETATVLGMPHGTTIGFAATELLLAVTDSAGPRCRSYRSAFYFLRERDHATVTP